MITTKCAKWHMQQMQRRERGTWICRVWRWGLFMLHWWALALFSKHWSILSNSVSWTDLCFRGKIAPNYSCFNLNLGYNSHKSPHQDSASSWLSTYLFLYFLILSFLIPTSQTLMCIQVACENADSDTVGLEWGPRVCISYKHRCCEGYQFMAGVVDIQVLNHNHCAGYWKNKGKADSVGYVAPVA